MEFDIYFPVEISTVPEKYIEIARSVLSQIVELDDMARSNEGEED